MSSRARRQQLPHDHISSAFDEDSPFDVTTSGQIYGTPSETVLEMIKQFDPGVPLIVKPRSLGGSGRAGYGSRLTVMSVVVLLTSVTRAVPRAPS